MALRITRDAGLRLRLGISAGLAVLCSACGHGEFGVSAAMVQIQQKPHRLDAEQLLISNNQIDCGVREQLWDPPTALGSRTLARLTDRARALKFDDDIVVSEEGHRIPYVQVRGDFSLVMPDLPDLKDAPDGSKLITGKVYAMVDHPCFQEPLPVMGVRRGHFEEDAVPVIRFVQKDDGWAWAGFVH